jgi:hypothetical protein
VLGWTSFSQIWQDAPTNTFFTAIPQTDCFLPTNFPEEPKSQLDWFTGFCSCKTGIHHIL